MAIRKVRVEDAVGMVLGHDMTKIVPGEYKGPAFPKGHIIKAEDIPHLKDIGKDHIYLIELAENQIHENEAVLRIAKAVVGDNLETATPSEGRINIRAAEDGLLKVNREAVNAINGIDNIVLSTLASNRLVKTGELIAGVKVVPLVVDQSTIETVEQTATHFTEILSIRKLNKLKLGVIITGNEVFYGRIEDKYAPVIIAKADLYGADILGITYRPDNTNDITHAILEYKQQGADAIIVTGGMSVDPDDVTPQAIRDTGAATVTYGTPVLPGAMFMLAYLGDSAIIGMPACGMFSKITVFDLVFPRIMAGEKLTKQDIAIMGYGGLCLSCEECRYPNCSFGK